MKVLLIPMSDILSDDEFNCRGRIVPVHVYELAKDIAENGLLQAIVVQPWGKDGFKYRIVCGHRRYMAHRINKADAIEATVKEGLSDAEAALLNLTENINREDLNILQEAHAIEKLAKEGWLTDTLCAKLSVSRQWLKVRLALLKLEPEIQKRAEAGMITQHQIMDISKMPTAYDRAEATQRAVEHKLKGEKKSLKLKAAKSVFTKKPRTITEIHTMQDTVREVTGNGLTTRFAAWAAGVISDRDFHWDLKDHAATLGVDWNPPDTVVPPSGE